MGNKIGIIGGSGLDDPKILMNPKEVDLATPYGKTSDKLICGTIGSTEVVVLARHSKEHSIFADKKCRTGPTSGR